MESCATRRLRAAVPHSCARSRWSPHDHDSARMTTILVVEDDPGIRRALCSTLRSRDFDVLEAATGETALVAAAARGPDLVVLDLGLPDLDGMEVLTRLRDFSDVPVVVLTVHDLQAE